MMNSNENPKTDILYHVKPYKKHISGINKSLTGILLVFAVIVFCFIVENLNPPVIYGQSKDNIAPFPEAKPEEVDLKSSEIEQFSDLVKKLVEDKKIVGGEILIVKSRKIVLHEAYGFSDKERELPLEKNSIYRIRSMTKPFIGTSIFILEEEGKLSLDDPVSKFIPSFGNDKYGALTIRHLIKHTTGFKQDAFPYGYWAAGNLRKAVDVLGENGPEVTPGEGFIYSDKNSATMGAIICEITGEPVENFIKKRILDPLGMKDTNSHFSPEYSWAPRMNSTYRITGYSFFKYWDNTRQQTTPFFRASGGLYTTVFDYARFLSVWMDRGKLTDGRILKSETVEKALKAGPYDGYAMHWEIFGSSEGPGFLPSFGHGGSDGTFAMAIPEKDIMVLYFTQTRGTPPIRAEMLPLIKRILLD